MTCLCQYLRRSTLGKGRKERVISLPEELFEALREMRADRRGDDEDFVSCPSPKPHPDAKCLTLVSYNSS